jgi:hypothetical protein
MMVIASLAFKAGPMVASAFGLAAGVLVVVLAAFAVRGRGAVPRAIDSFTAVAAAWGIVASRVFSPPATVKWLIFGDGALIAGLGFVGLLVHELLIERALRGPVAAPPGAAALTLSRNGHRAAEGSPALAAQVTGPAAR